MNHIINKKTIGIVFLAILTLLIFFSKTIYNYNLPEVTAVKPEKGRLNKMEISSGILDWAEVENTYAVVGGIVGDIFVKEGDSVYAGQELFRMVFDREEVERKLKEIEISREKINLDIQKINLDSQTNSSNYEQNLLEQEIEKAKNSLLAAEALYELGGISNAEWEQTQNDLQNLNVKLDDIKNTRSNQNTALQLELQAKKIDLQSLSLQEEIYQKTLEDYNTYAVITAPVSGMILSLPVKKGVRINENAMMTSIGTGNEYIAECSVSKENDFVISGDTCQLSNSSHVLDGMVSRVVPSEQGKTVYITIISEQVTAGESFDITFEKEGETFYTLVPNGALNQDSDGYFINQIKRREGILGKEYYLERLDVYIGDSDSENTVIIQGITFFEPIVLFSNKAVIPGDVVSLVNAGDFFEK